MLKVDDYELIRRKHLVDGMSQRAIARELGHARNTVAKAARAAREPLRILSFENSMSVWSESRQCGLQVDHADASGRVERVE